MKSNVFIIRHKDDSCATLSGWLKNRGGDIHSIDDEMGVIEATVSTELLHKLKVLPCVAYVREVFRFEPSPQIVVHPTDDAL